MIAYPNSQVGKNQGILNDIMASHTIEAFVFLGNPGRDYERTRHNVARRLIDTAAWKHLSWQNKFHARWAEGRIAEQRIRLLVPNTYMNESGKSVAAFCSFFKIDPEALCVVVDETDIDFGSVTLVKGGGLYGHNGLKSIASSLGSSEFWRYRIGVGRPARGALSSHVLGNFSPDEESVMEDSMAAAYEVLEEAIREGIFSRGASKKGKYTKRRLIEQAQW